MQPPLKSSPVIHRCFSNPILSAPNIPYHATLIFNAGVTKYQGRYVMVFRNDYGKSGDISFLDTNLGLAFSQDGIRWEVQSRPCWQWRDDEVRRVYDPRLTVIDGRCHICFAVDTNHGVRGGIAVTEDFERFDIQHITAPDNRNLVLFPEKIGGRYFRLERPMPVYSRGCDRFDLWCASSPDLRDWGQIKLVLRVEDLPFANDKVGPGAPPIRTKSGWLAAIHTVDRDESRGKNGWEPSWKKRYCAGLMLLDLNDPSRVIGLSREPLLAPETPYETVEGFRTHVIFPGGMILEDTGEVKIYYGAADTVECLATAHVDDLVKLCRPR